MPTDVVMPKLGLTMSHGTVARWLKNVGDAIGQGEPLLEVATDKINYEVEAVASGILDRIVGIVGEEYECGATLAVISIAGESAQAPIDRSRVDRPIASPAARKLARERNVPLAGVSGTGPRGRVTMSDVLALENHHEPERTVAHMPQSDALPTTLDPSRRAIFRKMSAAASIPLAAVETPVRVDALHALIERRRDFGWTAAIVYAVAWALRDDPSVRIDATTGAPMDALDIGLAADTPRGLIVPVVRGAQGRTLAQLQREIVRLATAAREGTIGAADIGGACFSISNVGPQHVQRVIPIVDPPQTAILGVGAATQRPAVVDGAVVAAWTIDLVLRFDHRFIDGAPAARFLAKVARGLSDPGLLL